MALIRRFNDNKNTDLVLDIQSSAHRRNFEFHVQRNRVDVVCTNPSRKPVKEGEPNYNDWRNALSEVEKLRVFALILDEYRKHSIGDEHGYRGAVLGVSDKGQIFLGANTATGQITSAYFKECAEQNMVSAASDLLAYQQVKRQGWDRFNPPKAPIFESLYMMGGVSQSRVPVSCPCGKCTDMLAKNMLEDGKVYALPILNQATFDYLNSTPPERPPAPAQQKLSAKDRREAQAKRKESGEPLTITPRAPSSATLPVEITIDRSQTLAAVRDAVTRDDGVSADDEIKPYHVWQTAIQHLNAERSIDLNKGFGHIAKMQRDAYAKLSLDAHKPTSLREGVLAAARSRILGEQPPEHLFEQVVTNPKNLTRRAKELLGHVPSATTMAARNQFAGRRSIPELDIAPTENRANLAAINDFMLSEIRHALADRIIDDPEAKVMGRSWLRKNIPQLRCVVIQLDDGTYHHAIECSGKYDASLPNAEAAAVVQALPSLGRCGIRDVWVMEMNGEGIKDGKLATSPKEGAERLIKRASKDGIAFHFIPLNEGKYDAQTVETFTFHRQAQEVMPALFKGSRPLESKAISSHRAWTDFLNQQPVHGSKAI
jgi:hypothetical protein